MRTCASGQENALDLDTGLVRRESDQSQPRIVLFRRDCLISDSDHAHGGIRITADTHYKLYVNGAFANAGPEKSNGQTWYVDQWNITSLLHEGMNTITV